MALGRAVVTTVVFGVSPKTVPARCCSLIGQGRTRRRLAGETPARATGTVALPDPLESLPKFSRVPEQLGRLVISQRAITADTALRLGPHFGLAPQFWLNLQSHYDLEKVQERLAGRLEKEVKVLAAA